MCAKQLPKSQWHVEEELGFLRIMTFVYGQFFLNLKLKDTTTTCKAAMLAIWQIAVSLEVMTVLLMLPRDHAMVVIDRYVKVFLSCRHRFCQLYYSDDTNPFLDSTSNFPSLLNLVAQMKSMDPYGGIWRVPASVTS